MSSRSGQQIGLEHLSTFEEYLSHGGQLPVARDGTLNLSELVRVTGIPKSSFYQNPKIEASPSPSSVGGASAPLVSRTSTGTFNWTRTLSVAR